MTSVQLTGAAELRSGAAGDVFDALSYADWGRAVVRLRESGTSAAMLWDSTITEPTTPLMDVVRNAFGGELTSRYVSVFADGNRYAVDALARRYGLSINQIMTTTGAAAALNLVLRTLVSPGDEVLVETPAFDVLARQARDAGAVVGEVSRPAPDYRVDLDDLAAKLTSRTRAVIITNLHNPTGARLTAAELRAVAATVAKVGAILVVDEVYADFAAEDAAPPPAALAAPNIVTVSSLTKVFGLFALKFGWLAGDTALLARIRAANPDGDVGVSKLSHAVAAHVLENPAPFEAHWRKLLATTRPVVQRHAEDLIADGLLSGAFPAHGCMYFPQVVGVADTRALARRLLNEFQVLIAPGEYFGAPGHIRIGFGYDPNALEEGFRRLRKGLIAVRG